MTWESDPVSDADRTKADRTDKPSTVSAKAPRVQLANLRGRVTAAFKAQAAAAKAGLNKPAANGSSLRDAARRSNNKKGNAADTADVQTAALTPGTTGQAALMGAKAGAKAPDGVQNGQRIDWHPGNKGWDTADRAAFQPAVYTPGKADGASSSNAVLGPGSGQARYIPVQAQPLPQKPQKPGMPASKPGTGNGGQPAKVYRFPTPKNGSAPQPAQEAGKGLPATRLPEAKPGGTSSLPPVLGALGRTAGLAGLPVAVAGAAIIGGAAMAGREMAQTQRYGSFPGSDGTVRAPSLLGSQDTGLKLWPVPGASLNGGDYASPGNAARLPAAYPANIPVPATSQQRWPIRAAI